jgi:hypothetical protein
MHSGDCLVALLHPLLSHVSSVYPHPGSTVSSTSLSSTFCAFRLSARLPELR